MAKNKIKYIDYYTAHIDDAYSPVPIEHGKLYLFRYVFYKHESTIGCSGRVSLTDAYCPKCGEEITVASVSTLYFYKGKQCKVASSGTNLNNAWANRSNGTTLEGVISAIYIAEKWPIETYMPPFGTVALDISWGESGIQYPANAMTLHAGYLVTMNWKLINNSGVDAIIKHTLQIKAHKGWVTWHGTGESAPHFIQQHTVPAGTSLVINSYRYVPSDWYGVHGVDWRILNEHEAVIYGLCYYSPGYPNPVYKLYNLGL
jgi:hypothetical protein